MDFMVSLPPLKGFNAILVLVDKFNKVAHFIQILNITTTQSMGGKIPRVFKHHSLMKDIVGNMDPRLTNKF